MKKEQKEQLQNTIKNLFNEEKATILNYQEIIKHLFERKEERKEELKKITNQFYNEIKNNKKSLFANDSKEYKAKKSEFERIESQTKQVIESINYAITFYQHLINDVLYYKLLYIKSIYIENVKNTRDHNEFFKIVDNESEFLKVYKNANYFEIAFKCYYKNEDKKYFYPSDTLNNSCYCKLSYIDINKNYVFEESSEEVQQEIIKYEEENETIKNLLSINGEKWGNPNKVLNGILKTLETIETEKERIKQATATAKENIKKVNIYNIRVEL